MVFHLELLIYSIFVVQWFVVNHAVHVGPQQLKKSYDFIIAGGGTAGSVLAARLSEDPTATVLLLEAGSTPQWCSTVPGTQMDWQYKTVPQLKSSQGLYNGQVNWPRGKALGGSSLLNYMLYTRGNRGDFDRWAALGNTGWTFDDVLPYFKRSEGVEIDELKNSTFRGQNGPIKVIKWGANAFGDAVLKAANESDLPMSDDYNGESQGFGYAQATAFQARRQSSYWSYLSPVSDRSNLDILTNAQVSRVLFDANRQAVGVEYLHTMFFNVPARVDAKREVIVSAGVVGTPQILMLSGVGPKEQLSQINVPQIVDLPVGQYLRDHIFTDLMFAINNQSVGQQHSSYWAQKSLDEYLTSGTGPYAQSGPFQVVGFARSGVSPDLPEPDLQFLIGKSSFYTPEVVRNLNVRPDAIPNSFGLTNGNTSTFFGFAVLLHPYSSGEIRLKSSSPLIYPIIDPKYLDNENDTEIILQGLKTLLKIIQAPTMRQLGAKVAERPLPACQQWYFLSDDYLRCLIKHRSFHMYNPISTARMGTHPQNSVVDQNFRVHGTQKLRVVDASVFPTHISGGPYAAVIMIAEKAAPLILGNGN